MRNIVAPGFFLFATCAISACGSGGSSVPGSIVNASGGGAPLGGTQSAAALAVAPVLLDGGVLPVPTYTGFNVTATDSQSTLDAFTDRYVSPNNATTFAYEPPLDPPGSHQISFSTTVPLTEEIFQLQQPVNGTNPQPPITLTYDSKQAGASTSTTYAAVAFYIGPTTNLNSSVAYDLEVSSGIGATAYDVRIACVEDLPGGAALISNSNATGTSVFNRYLCALPKYGSPSGFYATSLSSSLTVSSKFLTATIPNPVISGAVGAFAPTVTSYPNPIPTNPNGFQSPQIALVLDESGTASGAVPVPLPPTTNARFTLDYMYAEALNY